MAHSPISTRATPVADVALPGLLLPGALLVALLINAAYAYRNIISKSDYVYGDWVINYAAGFIRRGLSGEAALLIRDTTGLALPPIVLLFVSLLLLASFAGLYAVVRGRLSAVDLAILLSPAGLLFNVIELGNAGRKDIIVLFLTVCVGCYLTCGPLTRRRLEWGSIALGLMIALSAFTHELTVFFVAALVALVFFGFVSLGLAARGLAVSAALLVLAAVCLILVTQSHQLGPAGIAAICERLGAGASANCGSGDDSIGWLQRATSYGTGTVLDRLDKGIYPWLYLVPFVLSFGYIASFARQFDFSEEARRRLPFLGWHPAVHVLILLLVTLPLYAVAIDWGRWLSIWFVQSVLYIVICERMGIMTRKPDRSPVWRSKYVALAIAVISCFWSVPICCNSVPTLAQRIGVLLF